VEAVVPHIITVQETMVEMEVASPDSMVLQAIRVSVLHMQARADHRLAGAREVTWVAMEPGIMEVWETAATGMEVPEAVVAAVITAVAVVYGPVAAEEAAGSQRTVAQKLPIHKVSSRVTENWKSPYHLK